MGSDRSRFSRRSDVVMRNSSRVAKFQFELSTAHEMNQRIHTCRGERSRRQRIFAETAIASGERYQAMVVTMESCDWYQNLLSMRKFLFATNMSKYDVQALSDLGV